MIARVLPLILALTAITATLELQPQPRQSPAPSGNASPQNQSGNNASSPAAPLAASYNVVGANVDAEQAEQDESYGKQFFKNAITDPIVLLTVALFVLAVLQYRVYRAEVSHLVTIERAWMKVVEVRLDQFGPNLMPEATVVYKNIGRTPANIERVRLKLEVMAASDILPKEPDYGGLALDVPATLLPDEEGSSFLDYSRGPNQPLQPLGYQGIKNGDAHLYLIGCIEYRDVLEPQKERFTRFARRYDAPLSKKANRDVFVFPKAAGYNEAT